MVDERRSSQAQLNAGWCHTYSLPRVYSLMPDTKTLGQSPAPELQSLRLAGSKKSFTDLSVNGTQLLSADGSGIEIVATVNPSSSATQYGINFAVSASGGEITKLYYDVNAKQIVLDKSHSSLSADNEENTLVKGNYDEAVFGKPVKFQIFIDHSIIDVFINDAAAFSSRIYPTKADSKGIQLSSVGGTSVFSNVEVYSLDKAFGIAQTKVNLSTESSIAEHAENSKEIFVSVSNNTFKTNLNAAIWQFENLPRGVQAGSIVRISDTKAKIVLQGNSTSDYDTDRSLTVSVPASEFAEDKSPSLVSGTAVIFKAVQEPMTTLSLSSAIELKEGFEAGKEIELKVSSNKWKTVLNAGSWTLQNLPSGLQYNVSRIDSTRVKIALSGTAQDYDQDISNFTVTVPVSEFVNTDTEVTGTTVTANQGVLFKAVKGELLYDFESGNLTNWSIMSGNAFSNADVTNQTDWSGGKFMQQGNFHLWGFLDGADAQIGEIRTGTFKLEGDGKINFLIAGGSDINNLYLALVDASTGTELMKATGDNSETYKTGLFDAGQYKGLNCYLKAVDKSTGGWGHLNLDAVSVPVPDYSVMPLPPSTAVTGVVISPAAFSLALGETRTIAATISPENAINKSVTWSSSNPAVATIDSNGKATAQSIGTAILKVTTIQGGFTAQTELTVTQAQNYLNYDFESGDLSNWIITGDAFSNADVSEDTLFWSTTPFNQQGRYHLWSYKSGGDTQTGSIKTADFKLGGDGKISFLIGGGQNLNTLYIALVRASDGQVLYKETGKNSEAYTSSFFDASQYINEICYIKVVDNSAEGFGHLNIDNIKIPIQNSTAVPVTGITVSQNNAEMIIGTNLQITAVVSPASAANKAVIWSSSNQQAASVDQNGLIRALAVGTSVITVTTADGGFKAEAAVTVKNTPQNNYLIYDFESGNLSNWTITGDAFFNADVSEDTLFWGTTPFNQQGRYHLWSYKSGGDAQTGSIKTADFKLGGDGKISFLIGGGQNLNTLYIALVRASDGQVLYKETGNNSEAYTSSFFDASQYINEICYIKVVDNSAEGFGHLNIDNIKIPIQNSTAVPVTGITVSQNNAEMIIGTNLQITAVVSPASATNNNKAVIWSSSNQQAATVDQNGLIRALAAGTALITATTVDGGFKSDIAITVKENVQNSYLTYDFESGDLTGWTVTGSAFSNADVTNAVNWSWGGPFNQHGAYHLWSFKEGEDSQTGSIQTQNFRLGGDGKITCLLGGGFDINTLYLALVRASDGSILMKATGTNNDSEAYISKTLDAKDFIGTDCYIKIVDNATGGWGHLNVDNIRIPVQNSITGKNLSLKENNLDEADTKLIVYPNPSDGVFNVSTDQIITVSLSTLAGEIILKTRENRIDLTNRASGIYILNVQTPSEIKTFKIVKK